MQRWHLTQNTHRKTQFGKSNLEHTNRANSIGGKLEHTTRDIQIRNTKQEMQIGNYKS